MAAAQLEQLEAAGAKASRIRKAERRKASAEQQVRIGGGHTSRSVLWQMQNEEKSIDKVGKAIEAERKRNDERREAVRKLEAEIVAGAQLIQRLEQKKAEAVGRLGYLSQQKWFQWMPEQLLTHFKDVASTLGATQHQAHGMAQALVDLMVPPAEAMDIAADDTTSDSESCSMASGPTAPEEGDRADAEGCCDEPAPSPASGGHGGRIAELEARLEDLRRQKLSAMAQAQAAQLGEGRQIKRMLGADGEKSRDADGDDEMVPVLSARQADGLLRQRIDDTQEELRRLRADASSECVPCNVPAAAELSVTVPLPGDAPVLPQPVARQSSAAADECGDRPPLPRRGLRGRMPQGSATAQTRPQAGAARGIASRWETDEQRAQEFARDRLSQLRRTSLEPPVRAAGSGTCRAPSVPPLPTLRRLAAEVAREFDAQREAADRLVARVEIGKQSRMQEVQDRESLAHAAVQQAKAEIESKRMAPPVSLPLVPLPTYGPTGQRLDEQQRTMLCASASQVVEVGPGDVSMATQPAGRTSRWDRRDADSSPPLRRGRADCVVEAREGGISRGNSRSLRPRPRRREAAQ